MDACRSLRKSQTIRTAQTAKWKAALSKGGFNEGDFEGQDFSDFFDTMFGGTGGGRSRNVNYRGQDFNAELHLNLTEIFQSHKRTLTVNGKNLRITIPAGVENGQTIKITGHGGAGANGGPKGDLYITFVINNNTEFKRNQSNLYKNVRIDLYTAILGGEITVTTFDGKAKLKINPETQNGTRVKLKGKGFPVYRKDGQFGDLFITYTLVMPKNLSQEEKALFKKLAELKNKR